jgi:hypothetical protein
MHLIFQKIYKKIKFLTCNVLFLVLKLVFFKTLKLRQEFNFIIKY